MGSPVKITLSPETVWTCKKCGEPKLIGEFVKNSGYDTGYYNVCKKCWNEKAKLTAKTPQARKKRNTRLRGRYKEDEAYRLQTLANNSGGKSRRRYLKRVYNTTPEEIDALCKYQNNKCPICLKRFTKTPDIDHDHKNNRVRGLLCHGCNKGLGDFQDDPCRLDRAIAYLTRPVVEYRT